MTYAEKLKDPRWQKRRLELLEAAKWQCEDCRSKTNTLHVHHGCYIRATDPWDYPDDVMHVLCESCHDMTQGWLENLHVQIGRLNTNQIVVLGGLVECLGNEEGMIDAKTHMNILVILTTVVRTALSVARYPESRFDLPWLGIATYVADEEAQMIERANGAGK